MSILTNLKQRPVLRASSSVEDGVVIHFSRKLPRDIVKKPRNIREREAELPMEGAEAAEDAAGAGVFVTDKRHTVDFDRDAIMAKIRGSRTGAGVIPLQPPSFSDKFVSGKQVEDEPEMEANAEAAATAPLVVKLGKRAILPSDEVVKQTKASAALAIAEANERADFEEMRMPSAEGDTEAVEAEAVEAAPKKRLIRPKPKGTAAAAASGSVSAAAVGVKAAVKKIKEREDSAVNIAAYTVGDTVVATRLPTPRPLPQVQASEFYMNNRAKFIQYINALFRPYRDELTSGEHDITCESLYGGDDSASVSLLTHQKIVRDYLNIYSPYRGLLLFHGLGSGKTCSSIAIAEGLKTFKRIIVMTPASLRMNYIEEMKSKCGDLMYKKNQYWEFIESRGNPELTHVLSQILMFPDDKFVRANGGAWMVNVTKPSNYETELTPSQRARVVQDMQVHAVRVRVRDSISPCSARTRSDSSCSPRLDRWRLRRRRRAPSRSSTARTSRAGWR